MSSTAFGRGYQENGSHSNATDHNPTTDNGHAAFNGNGHTNGTDHAKNDGHVNCNGHANGHGHTNAAGAERSGNTNSNGKGGGVGSRFQYVRATLSSGVSIKGTVKFRSELVIDGHVEGTIESFGRLTVGRNGHVRGDIQTR